MLEVSRSIGDGRFKRCGVSCVPDVMRCTLTDNDRYCMSQSCLFKHMFSYYFFPVVPALKTSETGTQKFHSDDVSFRDPQSQALSPLTPLSLSSQQNNKDLPKEFRMLLKMYR